MEIITILVQENEAGQMTVNPFNSDGATLRVCEVACRFAADQYQKQRIEAEVEARVQAALGESKNEQEE